MTLLRTAEGTGLTAALSRSLSPWRKPLPQFDPGKIVTDLAVSLALGGDCLADVAALREHAAVFGTVPSDPTVSRLITALAANAPAVLTAIDTARASARAAAWGHAGNHAPDHDITAQHPIVIDLDATLVTAHSEKESAAPTTNEDSDFIHCWRSSTTARAAPVNPSQRCWGQATPDPTQRPIISRSHEKHWHSYALQPDLVPAER